MKLSVKLDMIRFNDAFKFTYPFVIDVIIYQNSQLKIN